MEKCLVTNGLNELKIMDNRINRAINGTKFVAASKVAEKNVSSNVTKEDFIAQAKADLQSVTDLIERRKRIKAAIVTSNANTMVKIGDAELSVADAIERKSSIEYEEDLLRTMKSQFANAIQKVVLENAKVEDAIERLVTTAFGKDSKTNIKSDDYSSIANPYKTANEFGLVDPIGIEAEIKKREDEIETFKSTVDSTLQVSNCTTWIEF